MNVFRNKHTSRITAAVEFSWQCHSFLHYVWEASCFKWYQISTPQPLLLRHKMKASFGWNHRTCFLVQILENSFGKDSLIKKMLAAKKLIKIVVWLTQKINPHEAVIICHYRRSLIKIPISIKELGDKLIKLGGKFSRDRVHFK